MKRRTTAIGACSAPASFRSLPTASSTSACCRLTATCTAPLACRRCAARSTTRRSASGSSRRLTYMSVTSTPAAGVRSAVTDEQPGAKPHVLLIEDDAPTGRFVSLALTPRFRVTTCRDGEAGGAVLRDDRVDVLLLDIALPSLATAQLGLLSEVRAPVVVLTDMVD